MRASASAAGATAGREEGRRRRRRAPKAAGGRDEVGLLFGNGGSLGRPREQEQEGRGGDDRGHLLGASESCVAAAAAVVGEVVVEVVVVVRDVFGLVRGCCNRQMSDTVTRKGGGGDEGETAKLQIMDDGLGCLSMSFSPAGLRVLLRCKSEQEGSRLENIVIRTFRSLPSVLECFRVLRSLCLMSGSL